MSRNTEVSPLIVTDRWQKAIPFEAEREPSMRTFGLAMLVGFGLLGTLSIIGGWRRAQEWRVVLGAVLGILGLTIFIWSLIAPKSLPRLYRAWMSFGLRIGEVMSTILLASVYLAVVTPIGWLMRLTTRDPLERRVSRGSGTYWQGRSGVHSPDDYQHMS